MKTRARTSLNQDLMTAIWKYRLISIGLATITGAILGALARVFVTAHPGSLVANDLLNVLTPWVLLPMLVALRAHTNIGAATLAAWCSGVSLAVFYGTPLPTQPHDYLWLVLGPAACAVCGYVVKPLAAAVPLWWLPVSAATLCFPAALDAPTGQLSSNATIQAGIAGVALLIWAGLLVRRS